MSWLHRSRVIFGGVALALVFAFSGGSQSALRGQAPPSPTATADAQQCAALLAMDFGNLPWAANSPNLQEDFAWRHNHGGAQAGVVEALVTDPTRCDWRPEMIACACALLGSA